MAAGEKEPVRSKEELIAVLEQSRRAFSVDLPALGHALNPIERARQSFTRHPAIWVAGSAVAGLAGTRMLASSRRHARNRKREGTPKSSKSSKLSLAPILGFLLKSAIATARPVAEKAVKKRVSRMLE